VSRLSSAPTASLDSWPPSHPSPLKSQSSHSVDVLPRPAEDSFKIQKRANQVHKRQSNVLKLSQENDKLKEELRAMTERLEAAERRRQELERREKR
jgi:flagellar motility protein MotE (MotC chaperone)